MLPDGLIPLAPEQARVHVSANQPFVLGFTLISADSSAAARLTHSILRGMRLLGSQRRPQRGVPVLCGNFRVEEAVDLVAGRKLPLNARLSTFGTLEPIPIDHIEREARVAAGLQLLTLRFQTPLRTHRPRNDRPAGRSMFDGSYFDPASLLSRLAARLAGIGVAVPQIAPTEFGALARLVENRLIWLDVTYGAAVERKSMDGAVGRVILDTRDPRAAELLAWGQYAHVGSATRWGLGGYRIEELGADLYACARSQSLAELAWCSPACDRVAGDADFAPGQLRIAARAALAPDFAPGPMRRIDIPKRDGGARTLMIPARVDLSLQRILLSQLAPGLDRFFEDSSLAYRAGLGRRNAARRIAQAFRDGYVYGVKADFRAFFDSVDHTLLKERLDAYLNDDATVTLLMKWVAAGAPHPGRGLPTGAPISPLLSNLMLDLFDEAVAREGGRLVRYADDFLILVRTPAEAEAVYNAARAEAESLLLALNDAKTATLDLREPFEFLGLRFERRQRWESQPLQPPRRVDELGWSETPRASAATGGPLHLPGETTAVAFDKEAVLIVGPAPARVVAANDELTVQPADQRPPARYALRRVEHLLLLGPVELDPSAVQRCLQEQIPVTIADENGRCVGALDVYEMTTPYDLLRAQLACQDDATRRLALARALVAAKLHNHASLAGELEPGGHNGSTATQLRTLAQAAVRAETIDALLGMEGAGAARWYELFAKRLGYGFAFERRVAPAALDPVNVLLNIAQTALHRQMIIACRVAALEPGLGVLHVPRAGHAALASDLQEPFRHLMDRVVLQATRTLTPGDFQRRSFGPLPLRISPPAARRFAFLVQEQFARACVSAGGSDPRTYRQHMLAQARSLRRALLDPQQTPRFFIHPGPQEPTP